MTFQLTDEINANTARLIELRRSDVPFLLIRGKNDPYLHVSGAEYLRSQVRNGFLHALEAGTGPRSTPRPKLRGSCARGIEAALPPIRSQDLKAIQSDADRGLQ